jgi:hypothetical protein
MRFSKAAFDVGKPMRPSFVVGDEPMEEHPAASKRKAKSDANRADRGER